MADFQAKVLRQLERAGNEETKWLTSGPAEYGGSRYLNDEETVALFIRVSLVEDYTPKLPPRDCCVDVAAATFYEDTSLGVSDVNADVIHETSGRVGDICQLLSEVNKRVPESEED